VTTREPEQISVPVDGGALAVLRWPADRPDAPLVVLLHDLIGSGRDWAPVAAALGGDLELLAPDLRGRAGSAAVPGPYGLEAHAEDLAALVERVRPGDRGRPDDVVLVGHAMGAFVAELAADGPARHRVRALVLVDGGLELPRPAGADLDTMIGAYLADAPEPDGPTVEEALRVDGADLFENEQVLEATTDLPVPATLLWAARGPQGESPGLYDRQRLALLGAGPSGITARAVPGTDHWSILSAPDGIDAIAEAVRAAVAG
jgi:pimeloyl-ACP methyl ester carboxylesterase